MISNQGKLFQHLFLNQLDRLSRLCFMPLSPAVRSRNEKLVIYQRFQVAFVVQARYFSLPAMVESFFQFFFRQFSCSFSFFLCRSMERSPFEVRKHVLRGEIISKFTLAMNKAIFFAVYIKDVPENGKRQIAKQFNDEQITKCDSSDSIFMLVWF